MDGDGLCLVEELPPLRDERWVVVVGDDAAVTTGHQARARGRREPRVGMQLQLDHQEGARLERRRERERALMTDPIMVQMKLLEEWRRVEAQCERLSSRVRDPIVPEMQPPELRASRSRQRRRERGAPRVPQMIMLQVEAPHQLQRGCFHKAARELLAVCGIELLMEDAISGHQRQSAEAPDGGRTQERLMSEGAITC